MNLPPFPSLPSSPQERLRWIAWGEEIARMERERCARIAWELGGNRCDVLAAAIRGEAERKDEK